MAKSSKLHEQELFFLKNLASSVQARRFPSAIRMLVRHGHGQTGVRRQVDRSLQNALDIAKRNEELNIAQPRHWEMYDRGRLIASALQFQAAQCSAPAPTPALELSYTTITGRRHFSQATLSQLRPITFAETTVPAVQIGFFLLCRTLTPAQTGVSLSLIAEDTSGDVCRIELYNRQSSSCIPEGTIFAIKEPSLKLNSQRNVLVKVDSPSDLVFLHPSHEFLKETSWYEPLSLSFDECKAQANQCYSRGQFDKALEFYDFALSIKPDDVLIHLNKAAAFLRLDRFFEAHQSAQAALADETSVVTTDRPLKFKALFRLAHATYGLRNWVKAVEMFSNLAEEYPSERAVAPLLRKSRMRLAESRTGRFDLEALAPTYGKVVYHDVADYVGPIAIADIPGKGRGLRTTAGIEEGTILMVSKAFALGIPEEGQQMTHVFDLNHKIALSPSEGSLITATIQALRKNPHRTAELYQLDSGNVPRVDLPDGIVDPGRIEEIVSVNQFGVANDCADDERDGSRNGPSGLWILPSFMNHSCIPNANGIVVGDIMIVRALRQMYEGQEVVLSYVSTSDRQKILRTRWNIVCRCAWCLEENATSPVVSRRRISLLETAKRAPSVTQLRQLITNLQATYKPADRFLCDLAAPLYALMMASRREADRDMALMSATSLMCIEPEPSLYLTSMARLTLIAVQIRMGSCEQAKQVVMGTRQWLWQRWGMRMEDLKRIAPGKFKEWDTLIRKLAMEKGQ
jgi:tetratricopeptide (TPR) repeat protein